MDYCSLFDVLNPITCFRLSPVNTGFYNEFKRRYPNLGEELKSNAKTTSLNYYDPQGHGLYFYIFKHQSTKTNETRFYTVKLVNGKLYINCHSKSRRIWNDEMNRNNKIEDVISYLIIREDLERDRIEFIMNPIIAIHLAWLHPTLFEISLARMKQSFKELKEKTQGYDDFESFILKLAKDTYNIDETNCEKILTIILSTTNSVYLN